MDGLIFSDVKQLDTPVGYFRVLLGDEEIPFSVIKNRMCTPYEIWDGNNKEVIGTITTDTNYSIRIDTSKLVVGESYTISFSKGKWELCDSDEHTVCYDSIIDNWVVGIGGYDPNDDNKLEQAYKYSSDKGYLDRKVIVMPEHYDESNFSSYTIYELDELNGFVFKLFDYSRDYIFFDVAWINIADYPQLEYESAIGLWLC